MKLKIFIILHIVLQLLAFTSWLWLDYKIIAAVALLHLVMLGVLRGCPLSHAQFPGDRDKRFYEWEFEIVGMHLVGRRRRQMRVFMQYILPIIILTAGILTQVAVGIRPLFVF